MRTGKSCRGYAWLGIAMIVNVPVALHAAEFDYEASLGAGHSDNISRVPDNEIDENIAAARLRFSLDQNGPRLRGGVVGDLAYANYLENTYDSEVLGNAAADFRLGLVPERFEWAVSDNFGQVLVDPFTAATPENRESVNYFVTGPDVFVGFGSQTRLRIGGRYALATYEDRPLDSTTLGGELGLIRALSEASSVALHARAAQTKYDEESLHADYDQNDAYVSYEIEGARTHLTLDLGYSEVERDSAPDKEDGLLFRIEASRRMSRASTLLLGAGREFSNSGNAFAASQNRSVVGLESAPGQQTTQPFQNDYLSLAWDFSRNRTNFGLSAYWQDQSYQDAPALDQTLITYAGRLDRTLSTRATLGINASLLQADYAGTTHDYDDVIAGVSFAWRMSTTMTLTLSYNYFDRSSDVATNEYTENRIWLSFGYGRGLPRNRVSGPEFAVDRGT